MTSRIFSKKLFLIGIIIAVIAVYIYLLINYSLNIPYADDFDAIYGWFLKGDMISSGWQFFLHFFSSHGEHRIVRNRIIQYILHLLTGAINIKTLIYIGNASLVFLLLFFWKNIKGSYKLAIFTIITLLLINLRYAESSFFGMAALSNLWVIVFGIRAIYFTNKDGNFNYIIALILSLFAMGTQGNGIVILPIIIGMYVFKRKIKYSIISFIVLIAFVSLYFVGYVSPEGMPSKAENIIRIFTHPENLFFPFAFLGNIIGAPAYYFKEIFSNYGIASRLIYIPPVIIGIVFASYFIYLTFYKKYYKKNLLIYSIFIFILMSDILVSLSRVQFGYLSAVTSRYAIYSILFLCCMIVSFVDIGIFSAKSRKKIYGMLILAIFVNIFFTTFTYYFRLLPNSQQRVKYLELYLQGDNSHIIYPGNINHASEILDKAIENKYYMP